VTSSAARTRTDRPDRVVQRGRSKAYRPLTADARRRALRDGLAAYERGDYFEAHERLEPAWMGTADPAERDLYQGLIKLAAGYVHAVRGNPLGVANNLAGARERLAAVVEAGGPDGGLDLPAFVADIDAALEAIASLPADAGAPLPLAAPTLHRR
jgi:predicted metal-dependent hydrolase